MTLNVLARLLENPDRVAQEEYLSVRQLCERIPYKEQTVRNLMTQGVLKRDVHYVKPRGRVMFKWSAVRAWLEEQQ